MRLVHKDGRSLELRIGSTFRSFCLEDQHVIGLAELYGAGLISLDHEDTGAIWAKDLQVAGLTLTWFRRCYAGLRCPFTKHKGVPFWLVGSELYGKVLCEHDFELIYDAMCEKLKDPQRTAYMIASSILEKHGWKWG